jgi:hypothetical protein
MAFVQIIEFRTQDLEGVRKLDQEWLQATAGKRTARRQIVARDRNQADRYLAIVFFDSFESAMENSKLAETDGLARSYSAFVDGQPIFYDLDIISDEQL